MARTSRTTGEHSRRIAERDRLDERVGKKRWESNLSTSRLSRMSRASRATVWTLADFSGILL
jgi:hypothetical protein